ncbi:MAG: DUF4433 domain-containing protein [Bacteroidales bacterium]|nr:DUF4433 domain-containing protein [Bacteroidales bacterium]
MLSSFNMIINNNIMISLIIAIALVLLLIVFAIKLILNKKKIRKLKKTNENIKGENINRQNEIKKLKESNKNIKRQIDVQDIDIRRLTEQIKNYENSIKEHLKNNKLLSDKCKAKQYEIDILKNKNEKLNISILQKDENIDVLEEETFGLKSDNIELKEKLEALEFKFEELKKFWSKNTSEEKIFLLGCLYKDGKYPMSKDYEQSVYWLSIAAGKGNPIAQYRLARNYYNGLGVEKDYEKAFNLFKKASDKNHVKALYYLGKCYEDGKGIEQDYTKAVFYYQKASDKDYAKAHYKLGECYEEGKGVEKDLTKAIDLFKSSANKNDVYAKLKLATYYTVGDNRCTPTWETESYEFPESNFKERNYEKALSLLKEVEKDKDIKKHDKCKVNMLKYIIYDTVKELYYADPYYPRYLSNEELDSAIDILLEYSQENKGCYRCFVENYDKDKRMCPFFCHEMGNKLERENENEQAIIWYSKASKQEYIYSAQEISYIQQKQQEQERIRQQELERQRQEEEDRRKKEEQQRQEELTKRKVIDKFLNKFSQTPHIYHFTHLYNAVEIIKNEKILSRNQAEGHFANAAGGLVNRRTTAHDYARFYFRPKTPTQFYNECLGKDSSDSYYEKALKLLLPKCPMPIFFVFDLKEILYKFYDKCFYSDGNMQKDNTRIFKIDNEPIKLNTQFLYSTVDDGFDEYLQYSQQEFLIKDELDFSTLQNYKIIAYNEVQANILQREIGNKYVINFDDDNFYFNKKNETLNFVFTNDILQITSSYKSSESYFLVRTQDGNENSIVKNIKIFDREFRLYPKIEVFTRDILHYEIYFVCEELCRKEWLIYRQ